MSALISRVHIVCRMLRCICEVRSTVFSGNDREWATMSLTRSCDLPCRLDALLPFAMGASGAFCTKTPDRVISHH